jgi:hypothetical protein
MYWTFFLLDRMGFFFSCRGCGRMKMLVGLLLLGSPSLHAIAHSYRTVVTITTAAGVE